MGRSELAILIPALNESKTIFSVVQKVNKFGIPFNAFYSSKFPEGIVMNEILTEKQIFEIYNKVK